MSNAFDELWTRYLEGELDEAGFAELQRLLVTDPELCRRAADLYEEHRLLGLIHTSVAGDEFVREALSRVESESDQFLAALRSRMPDPASDPAAPPRTRRRWLEYGLVASVSLVLSVLGFGLLRPNPTDVLPPGSDAPALPVAPPAATYVATLLRHDACRWTEPSNAREGQRLTTGALKLAEGTALVRFDGGALLILSGPAELRLHSAGRAEVLSGRVTVRAPEEAVGFVVCTPASDFIDLGTEFAVSVGGSGATEVQVLEGEVEWQKPGRPARDSAVLTAGQALRFDSPQDERGQPIRVSAGRFDDLLGTINQSQPAGKLLAYEPFRYEFARTTTKAGAANGGFGWAGPWSRKGGDPDAGIDFLVADSLAGPTGSAAPAGGRLELPAEPLERGYREACSRRLAVPIDLDAEGVYFLSFRCQKAAAGIGVRNQWLRVLLAGDGDPLVRTGLAVMSDNRVQILDSGGNSRSDWRITNGEPYLFVGKLVTSRNGPDQMFLKVYGKESKIDDFEPMTWTASGYPAYHTGRLVELNVFNGADWAWSVDEIRFGTSWTAVTKHLSDK